MNKTSDKATYMVPFRQFRLHYHYGNFLVIQALKYAYDHATSYDSFVKNTQKQAHSSKPSLK